MSKNKLTIAFLLVFASFCIHFYLMSMHYDFAFGLTQQKSVCSINQKFDCESVSISPYAYLLGIPLATWGMSFHFIFLFLFGFFLFYPERRSSVERWMRVFAAGSLLATLSMGAISLAMMQAYCIFCMTLYVLSILNFAVFFVKAEKPFFPHKEDLQWKPLLICFGLLPIIAWMSDGMNVRSALEKVSGMTQDSMSSWEAAPLTEITAPILVEGVSPDKAKMTIAEFADFNCIHCRDSAHGIHSFVSSKPDVRMEYYAFPLDGSCHAKIPGARSEDGNSCRLARAAYCANKQSKGWQAHQWIFDRFGSNGNLEFEKLVSDLQLDSTQFNACINSDEAFHAIESNTILADKLRIDSTPTVFVNGKQLLGGNTVFVLEAAYKKLHSN